MNGILNPLNCWKITVRINSKVRKNNSIVLSRHHQKDVNTLQHLVPLFLITEHVREWMAVYSVPAGSWHVVRRPCQDNSIGGAPDWQSKRYEIVPCSCMTFSTSTIHLSELVPLDNCLRYTWAGEFKFMLMLTCEILSRKSGFPQPVCAGIEPTLETIRSVLDKMWSV